MLPQKVYITTYKPFCRLICRCRNLLEYPYSDDHIEIMLHYVDTPIKPKPIEYDKDTSPEGESLRGSLIYTTKIFVDNDIFKGMNKKILEPAFKETQKMPVLIEIRG